MVRAFISLGSNIDPDANVRRAIGQLAARMRVVGISMVYLTEALGRPEQDPYYNCVVEVRTSLPPHEIKRAILRPIEAALGRVRTADKYAARTIDMDLIIYGDLALDEEGMRLPDPEIMERPFLAYPLRELAPGWVLAGSKRPIEEVALALPADGMRRLPGYASQLRRDFLS